MSSDVSPEFHFNAAIPLKTYKQFSQFSVRQAITRKSKKGGFIQSFFIWLVLAVAFMYFFQAAKKGFTSISIENIAILYTPVIAFFFTYAWKVQNLRKAMMPFEHGTILAFRELILNDSGITFKSAKITTEYQWGAIQSVTNDHGNVYLYIDNLMAIIIDANEFTSPEHRKSCIQFIKSKCM